MADRDTERHLAEALRHGSVPQEATPAAGGEDLAPYLELAGRLESRQPASIPHTVQARGEARLLSTLATSAATPVGPAWRAAWAGAGRLARVAGVLVGGVLLLGGAGAASAALGGPGVPGSTSVLETLNLRERPPEAAEAGLTRASEAAAPGLAIAEQARQLGGTAGDDELTVLQEENGEENENGPAGPQTGAEACRAATAFALNEVLMGFVFGIVEANGGNVEGLLNAIDAILECGPDENAGPPDGVPGGPPEGVGPPEDVGPPDHVPGPPPGVPGAGSAGESSEESNRGPPPGIPAPPFAGPGTESDQNGTRGSPEGVGPPDGVPGGRP